MTDKKYKYITIRKDNGYGLYHRKPVYEITHNKSGDILGLLTYYRPWKQFVFNTAANSIIFNNECLKDITDFMEAL